MEGVYILNKTKNVNLNGYEQPRLNPQKKNLNVTGILKMIHHIGRILRFHNLEKDIDTDQRWKAPSAGLSNHK